MHYELILKLACMRPMSLRGLTAHDGPEAPTKVRHCALSKIHFGNPHKIVLLTFVRGRGAGVLVKSSLTTFSAKANPLIHIVLQHRRHSLNQHLLAAVSPSKICEACTQPISDLFRPR